MGTTVDEMRADYDWREAFKYAAECEPTEGYVGSLAGFTFDDVAEVIARDDGENDGPNWIAVFRLRDGRFAFLSAGCDYTGWGCQESGSTWFAASLGALVQWGLTDDARGRLASQLPAEVAVTPTDTPAAQAAAGDVWRVVLADGDVGVCVPRDCEDGSWSAVVRWPGGAMSRADGADAGQAVWRAAVERCEWLYGRDDVAAYVVEVLAPGESPRAELAHRAEQGAVDTARIDRALATIDALTRERDRLTARLRAPLAGDLAAIEARAVSQAAALDALRAEAREHGDDSYGYGICRVLSVLPRGVDPDVTALLAQQAAHAAALDAAVAAARAEALREAAASEAGELAARDAAMRGTLAAPSLATMRALHRAGGCWLVSYDDDDSGDPVTTVEYFDGARALAEKEGDNPVRWVAVDRCGRVCLPPQADATDGAP